MLIGLGTTDNTGFDSGPLPVSQTPVIPIDVGLSVPGAIPGEVNVTATPVGAQTPQNQWTADQVLQFIQQYGQPPATGSAPPSTSLIPGISNTALVIGAAVLLFLFLAMSRRGR